MAERLEFVPELEVQESVFGRYQLRPRDVVHVLPHAGPHEFEMARACVDFCRDLHRERGRKVRLVVDIRKMRGLPAKARRLYSSEEHTSNLIGVAMVIDGGVSRVVGNFGFGLVRGFDNTKLFNTTADAIAWLESLPDA